MRSLDLHTLQRLQAGCLPTSSAVTEKAVWSVPVTTAPTVTTTAAEPPYNDHNRTGAVVIVVKVSVEHCWPAIHCVVSHLLYTWCPKLRPTIVHNHSQSVCCELSYRPLSTIRVSLLHHVLQTTVHHEGQPVMPCPTDHCPP